MNANEQAGDPFGGDGIADAKPNVSAEDRDGVAKDDALDESEGDADCLAAIQDIQDNVRQPAPELADALSTLEDYEVAKEEEAEAEETAGENLSIQEVRDIVKVTAKAVEDANVNLENAQKAFQIASALEVDCSAKPTLAELNRTQVKVTATEVRRKGRAMKALGELGFGDRAKPKPHPLLFR